jgi:DNA invertase Pin-like site-specific DNA recombinase
MNKYVSYYRVSTDKQGVRGLGMQAQRSAVERLLNGQIPLAEFSEVESGKRKDRPELLKAIELCRKTGAILVIAKLDRLARNAAFTLGLRDSGVEFIAADMPSANRLTIGIMAVVAEDEAERISKRVTESLAEILKSGRPLGISTHRMAQTDPDYVRRTMAAMTAKRQEGFAAAQIPILAAIREITAVGVTSLRDIARCLTARGLKTVTGKNFHPQTVKNLLALTAA